MTTCVALSLNDSGWLLVEAPFAGWPVRLPKLIGELEIRGFRVLIAHPERAEAIQHSPDRLRDLVGRGALVQANASSFMGDHGRLVTQTAKLLLRNELIHVLASDAHSATWRPPGVAEGQRIAARELGVWPDQLDWMVNDGPRQILEGGVVPPAAIRPAAACTRRPRPGPPARLNAARARRPSERRPPAGQAAAAPRAPRSVGCGPRRRIRRRGGVG